MALHMLVNTSETWTLNESKFKNLKGAYDVD